MTQLEHTMHEDGSATVHIPEGYLGECSRCMAAEATTGISIKLANPVKGGPIFTEDKGWIEMPDITGLRVAVCDACLRDDDKRDES